MAMKDAPSSREPAEVLLECYINLGQSALADTLRLRIEKLWGRQGRRRSISPRKKKNAEEPPGPSASP